MGRMWSRHPAGFAFLGLCSLIFAVVPMLQLRHGSWAPPDYQTVYSSAGCLLHGCDPYNSDALLQEYLRSTHGTPPSPDSSAFTPYQALYPPSSLFWLSAFSLFPWKVALPLWMVANILLFLAAAVLIADICADFESSLPLFLLSAFVATSTVLVTTGQPSSMAISLCTIGAWFFLRDRSIWLGCLCLGLSVAIKPHTGWLVVLYFLLVSRSRPRRAALLVIATVLCLAPGLLWAAESAAASNWPHSVATNIAGSSLPGNANDPTVKNVTSDMIVDLQAIIAVFSESPSIYNSGAYLVAAALSLIWVNATLRQRGSRPENLFGTAAAACLCLLPFYHRAHDIRLLVLIFPASAWLIDQGRRRAIAGAFLPAAVILLSHPNFLREHLHLQAQALAPVAALFLLRASTLTVLAGAIFYLSWFVRLQRDPAELMERRRVT
jgi:hypothetical protein